MLEFLNLDIHTFENPLHCDGFPLVVSTLYLEPKIHYVCQFGEHPEERANNEEITEKLAGVTTLNEIYSAIKEKVPKFEPIR